ncbi:hypothetical protein [Rhodoferax mekongensis]|uniref:Rad50/SbcC-type AAA domain-containing protein n=1 Tax=Rhodoferax mekongensis TaxID=3068341 RepID=A0ABZ0AWD8_9BURK|nr:hypothetical protein [Rhodoferax sp. TBRC 17307]WNO03966.1 hypothetical protein RAN89_13745 [Rhodoferax sp. TBRC 17307]
MSNLQFKRIRICSEAEQAAMELEFHPRKNLLWGPNGAGKSAILKSVFRAFDAEPKGHLPGWDYNAIVAVDFAANGRDFTVVRRGSLRALFEGNALLGTSTSSSTWNEIFGDATGFGLRLVDQKGVFRRAAPANYFLPFFINQDGSFGSSWETFESLRQFQNFAIHTLEYFAKVRLPRYFDLKALEQGIKSKEADLRVEINTLQRTRARLKKNLRTIPVKLSQQEFQQEVHQLNAKLSFLSKDQDSLRRGIVEDQDLVNSLEQQIRLSSAALKEHKADFKFAADTSVESQQFVCPTCHAAHNESFHMFLGLAEDARELNTLKARLEDLLTSTKARLERKRRKAISLKQEFVEIQALLATKRGKFTFDDFIQSRSAFAADTQLAKEEQGVSSELLAERGRLLNLKAELKELKQSHDSEAPVKAFRENFRHALVELGFDEPEGIESWTLAKRPSDSGSRHARSIVAYYAAFWRTVAGTGDLPTPLVIDSPNQGAQDKKRLQALLTAIATNAPAGAQVILAHEEIPEFFDADKIHAVKDTDRVLSKASFEQLSPQMFFYVEEARASLAKINLATVDGADGEAQDEMD